MRMLPAIIALLIGYCSANIRVYGQEGVPAELVYRTSFIRKPDAQEGGTAFSIDYKGRVYIVTARHVIEGVGDHDAVLQLRRTDKWEDYHTVKTIYPSSPDVDIAVFATNETTPQPFSVGLFGATPESAVSFGQVVWFIGYPFGMAGVAAKGGKISPPTNGVPFIKRGGACRRWMPQTLMRCCITSMVSIIPDFPEVRLFIMNFHRTNTKFLAW